MSMIRWFCAVALALGLSTLGIVAGAAPPLEIYGSLPGFEMAKLSPSGQRIAMIGVIGDERRLSVLEGKDLILTAAVGTQKVRELHWAGNGTVLLKLSNTAILGIGFTAEKTEVSSMMVIDLASVGLYGLAGHLSCC